MSLDVGEGSGGKRRQGGGAGRGTDGAGDALRLEPNDLGQAIAPCASPTIQSKLPEHAIVVVVGATNDAIVAGERRGAAVIEMGEVPFGTCVSEPSRQLQSRCHRSGQLQPCFASAL
jgi:hypothetical protein